MSRVRIRRTRRSRCRAHGSSRASPRRESRRRCQLADNPRRTRTSGTGGVARGHRGTARRSRRRRGVDEPPRAAADVDAPMHAALAATRRRRPTSRSARRRAQPGAQIAPAARRAEVERQLRRDRPSASPSTSGIVVAASWRRAGRARCAPETPRHGHAARRRPTPTRAGPTPERRTRGAPTSTPNAARRHDASAPMAVEAEGRSGAGRRCSRAATVDLAYGPGGSGAGRPARRAAVVPTPRGRPVTARRAARPDVRRRRARCSPASRLTHVEPATAHAACDVHAVRRRHPQ